MQNLSERSFYTKFQVFNLNVEVKDLKFGVPDLINGVPDLKFGVPNLINEVPDLNVELWNPKL